MAIIVLAILTVMFGGGNSDASQLYYDADFVELYKSDVEELDEMADVQVDKPRPPSTDSDNGDGEAIPTKLTGEVDPRMLSEEIYNDITM